MKCIRQWLTRCLVGLFTWSKYNSYSIYALIYSFRTKIKGKYAQRVRRCVIIPGNNALQNGSNAFDENSSIKNILFCIHWFELGGAESYALHCMRVCKSFGWNVYCIGTVPSEGEDVNLFSDISVETIAYPTDKNLGGFQIFIHQFIKSRLIDVVHIHHSDLAYRSLPFLKKSFPDLKIIDSTHIVELAGGGFVTRSLFCSRLIDRHNVISKTLKNYYMKYSNEDYQKPLNASKVHVTYLTSINDKSPEVNYTFPRCLKEDRKELNILFYSRLSNQKQPWLFIYFAEFSYNLLFKKMGLKVKYHVVGSGDQESQLITRINKSKIKNMIRYYGRIDEHDKVYEKKDFLILTSKNEGITLTSYEALKRSLIVVSTDVGAQRELLGDYFVVNQTLHFIREISCKVLSIIENKDKAIKEYKLVIERLKQFENKSANRKNLAQLYSFQHAKSGGKQVPSHTLSR